MCVYTCVCICQHGILCACFYSQFLYKRGFLCQINLTSSMEFHTASCLRSSTLYEKSSLQDDSEADASESPEDLKRCYTQESFRIARKS